MYLKSTTYKKKVKPQTAEISPPQKTRLKKTSHVSDSFATKMRAYAAYNGRFTSGNNISKITTRVHNEKAKNVRKKSEPPKLQ